MYHIVPEVRFNIYNIVHLVCHGAVRSGLPDGLLLLLLPRHLSMLRVVKWGILRFMKDIWYGTLLVSE